MIFLLTTLLLACLAGEAAARDIDIAMHQADSGNFYIRAGLGADIETDLLLDTGAGYVSLSRSTFERIAEHAKPTLKRHIYGTLADGRVIKVPVYNLATLALAGDCVLEDIEVTVLPQGDKDILGLNALSRLQPFTIEFEPAKLLSHGCARAI